MNTLLVSAVPAFESGNQTEICNKLQEFTKEVRKTSIQPDLLIYFSPIDLIQVLQGYSLR